MFTGQLIEPLEPGSSEWLQTVSASKISAILGLSTYDSPYSLWARMTGRLEQEPGSKATERGTYLEPAILAWWKDQRPEYRVKTGQSYAHPWRPTWTAAPDGVAHPGRKRKPVALVEVKTAYRADEWGKPGTAEIPPAYLAQVAWQLHVTGAERCYIAALVNMELQEYVVTAEDVAADIELIVSHVERFEKYLETDTAPDFDGAEATYQAVRKLHPDIDPDATVEADTDLIDALQGHKAAEKVIKADLKQAQSEAIALMGTARTLTGPDGTVIAIRQAKGNGTPYLAIK